MPSSTTVINATLGILGTIAVLYPACISLIFTIPSLQRHAVYQHRLLLVSRKNLNHPDRFGFAHRQATPFNIKTVDGVTLHAWHVLPLTTYQKHTAALLSDERHQNESDGLVRDFTQTLNFRLLRDDPRARLVIHTHGASGALAAYTRPEAYRSLAAAGAHVLAFDYRGFGLSSGIPSEDALLQDALAVFRWATDVALVPAERIVVFGQSLGAGVAVALVRELALSGAAPVAGTVVTAGFTDVQTLLAEYRLFGVNLLGPVFRWVPGMRDLMSRRLRNRWPTRDRLVDFVRASSRFHIEIFHAKDDPIVPWRHGDVFFESAVKAAMSEEKRLIEDFTTEKIQRKIDMGEGGWSVEWKTVKGLIRQEVPRVGVHDKIMSHPQIALAVIRAFQSADPGFEG